jgi:ABC-2 type transport system permease protein
MQGSLDNNVLWNTAIWRKTWGDQRGLFLSLAALWLAFPSIYIWLSAQISMTAFAEVLLRAIPEEWQRLSGVPFSEVATHAGRVALAFVDPVIVLAATVWGITRGSDAVSGQLERGTMEMTLAQPVRRLAVFATQAFATTAGAAALTAVLMIGVWIGITAGPWAGEVQVSRYLPAALNVFGLMVCMAGLSACVSAFDSYRYRTIGIMCGFYVLSLLAKLIGRMSQAFSWVGYLSVFNAYEPQPLVASPAMAWELLARFDGVLLGTAILAYAIGAIAFVRPPRPAVKKKEAGSGGRSPRCLSPFSSRSLSRPLGRIMHVIHCHKEPVCHAARLDLARLSPLHHARLAVGRRPRHRPAGRLPKQPRPRRRRRRPG